LLVASLSAVAADIVFDGAQVAARRLSTRDAFVRRLGPFDRSARLKTNGIVTEQRYLAFMAGTALDWTPAQRARIQSAFDSVRPALERLALPLPSPVHLLLATGAGEGNAAYTRGDAIVLPRGIVDGAPRDLPALIAHEMFHVASRANPALRDRLYACIGFQPCGEVLLPEHLRDQRITNPDAPANAHAIAVEVDGHPVWAVPVLHASGARYDAAKGGEFFDQLVSELLLVERTGAGSHRLVDPPRGRLVPFDAAKGFHEQVGRNTGYTIHPEEILADNFALLATEAKGVRSPDVLGRIRAVLLAGPGDRATPGHRGGVARPAP
jgi:hypothetical protein